MLLSTRVVSITLRSGVHNCCGVLEQMIQCVVLAVGLFPSYVQLAFTWCHSRDECSQAFPVFHWSSALVESKLKVKMGKTWERGYQLTIWLYYTVQKGISSQLWYQRSICNNPPDVIVMCTASVCQQLASYTSHFGFIALPWMAIKWTQMAVNRVLAPLVS